MVWSPYAVPMRIMVGGDEQSADTNMTGPWHVDPDLALRSTEFLLEFMAG
jgi:hypothetical protein